MLSIVCWLDIKFILDISRREITSHTRYEEFVFVIEPVGLFEVRLNSDYFSIFVGILLCSVQVSTFWFGFSYFRGNQLACLMQVGKI